MGAKAPFLYLLRRVWGRLNPRRGITLLSGVGYVLLMDGVGCDTERNGHMWGCGVLSHQKVGNSQACLSLCQHFPPL